jgi:DNA-binding transcriptional LysR family regulator
VRAPRDSARRVRPYPGTKRGLFASPEYVAARGNPSIPDDLAAHSCIGSGTWKLSRGSKTAAPHIVFTVVVSDPVVHLDLALSGLGIAILLLYMAKRTDTCNRLMSILSLCSPEPHPLRPLLRFGAPDSQGSSAVGFPWRIPGNRSRPPASECACEGIVYGGENSRQRRGPDDCGSC